MKVDSITKSNTVKKVLKTTAPLQLKDELIAKPIKPEDVKSTFVRLTRNDSSSQTVNFEEGSFKKIAKIIISGFKKK